MTTISEWRRFFIGAGLPHSVASSYAETFSDHRIQMNMLKDLNKDILLDMKIKAMGDVIAILRHANNIQFGPKNDKRPQPSDNRASSARSGAPSSSRTDPKNTQPNAGVKRLASQVNQESHGAQNISSSLAKRLAPPLQTDSSTRHSEFTEKTLSVKLPKGTTERTQRYLSQVAQKNTLRSTVASVISIRPPVESSGGSHINQLHEQRDKSVRQRLGGPTNHNDQSSFRSRTSLNSNVFSRLG